MTGHSGGFEFFLKKIIMGTLSWPITEHSGGFEFFLKKIIACLASVLA